MQVREIYNLTGDAAYDQILEALEAVEWNRAREVFPIRPLDKRHLEFFPGHRGFDAPTFPIKDGIMIVGNNFSSLNRWKEYCNADDRESSVPTWNKLRAVIKASEVDFERFWFTNYCLGVLDRKKESYDFPASIVSSLKFEAFFERCVAAMKPALIVTLGASAARHVGTDFVRREKIERRKIAGHKTKLMAIVHPSGWTWQRRGFTLQDFRLEGRRIGAAFRDI